MPTTQPPSTDFRELLSLEVARARRYKVPLSVLMADIDRFKQLNDTFGPASGDKVLKLVTGLLRASLRMTDFVCRRRGDEFVIILTHTDGMGARHVAERLIGCLGSLQLLDEFGDVAISMRFLVGEYRPAESSDSFIKRMDDDADDDPDGDLPGVPVRV